MRKEEVKETIEIEKRYTKKIKIGNAYIGGDSPVLVQSMLNAESGNIKENIKQAKELENAGCEIVRVSIPEMKSVKLIDELKKNVKIPVVADIHFDYKLALESLSAGADKIRINPGNIGDESNIKLVAESCNKQNIPIRIGVNSGSLEKEVLSKYNAPSAVALCESALYNISLLEKFNFTNIVVSVKSSSVKDTVNAYRMLSKKCNYPLHVGVTEAGTEKIGIFKSAIGIGALLLDGIGDTIRVSLTSNPLKEVEAGINILKSIGLREGINIVSCPTCGRTKVNLVKIVDDVEKRLSNKNYRKNLKIAIMGCVVNGPGEAADADIGICGGNGVGVLLKKGKIIKKIPENKLVEALVKEIECM